MNENRIIVWPERYWLENNNWDSYVKAFPEQDKWADAACIASDVTTMEVELARKIAGEHSFWNPVPLGVKLTAALTPERPQATHYPEAW